MIPTGNVKAASSGGVVVSHREYLGDVYSKFSDSPAVPTAFSIAEYILNPGNSITFPWLAPIARSFEEYRIRKMMFQFRSTSGNSVASANTALGAVMLATQYNVTNMPFASKIEMENYAHGQSGVPSQDILHQVDLKKAASPLKTLYVREDNTPVPSGQDPRLYDFGKFSIATQGQQANATDLGELWCSYVIELIKPKIPTAQTDVLLGSLTDHFALDPGVISATGGKYFGVTGSTTQDPATGSTLGGKIADIPGNGNYYLFPGYGLDSGLRLPIGTKALFHYDMVGAGTTLTVAQITWTPGINWSAFALWRNSSQAGPDYNNINGAINIAAQGGLACMVKTSDGDSLGDHVSITAGTLCTSPGSGDLVVTLIPAAIV